MAPACAFASVLTEKLLQLRLQLAQGGLPRQALPIHLLLQVVHLITNAFEGLRLPFQGRQAHCSQAAASWHEINCSIAGITPLVAVLSVILQADRKAEDGCPPAGKPKCRQGHCIRSWLHAVCMHRHTASDTHPMLCVCTGALQPSSSLTLLGSWSLDIQGWHCCRAGKPDDAVCSGMNIKTQL